MDNNTCNECGEEADPKYTIDFSILQQPPMHYCSICGEMVKALKSDIDAMISGGE